MSEIFSNGTNTISELFLGLDSGACDFLIVKNYKTRGYAAWFENSANFEFLFLNFKYCVNKLMCQR